MVTRELHGLTVDDEVRQLLSDLSTFLFVLWKVELLAQFHVKHLQTDREHRQCGFMRQSSVQLDF